MSARIPPEVIEYERYVDSLRRDNALMRVALQKLIAKADYVIGAIDGATDQFDSEVSALSKVVSEAERLLKAKP